MLSLRDVKVEVGDALVRVRGPLVLMRHLLRLGFRQTPASAADGGMCETHSEILEMQLGVHEVEALMVADLHTVLRHSPSSCANLPSNVSGADTATHPPHGLTPRAIVALIERSVEVLSSQGGGGVAAAGVQVQGDEVLVNKCYALRERLRAAGFRWRKELKSWGMPLDLVVLAMAEERRLGKGEEAQMEEGGARAEDMGAVTVAAKMAGGASGTDGEMRHSRDEADAAIRRADEDKRQGAHGGSNEMNGLRNEQSWAVKICAMAAEDLLQRLEAVLPKMAREWANGTEPSGNGDAIANSSGAEEPRHKHAALLAKMLAPRLGSPTYSLSDVVSSSDGSPQRSGPDLRVDGDEVAVGRCYDIKDALRERGFR